MTALSQLYRSAAPAQAVENAENAAPTVQATVQHAETGQITAQIEAYMTDPANKTRTVKPCDIIFLIEQSQFMNTHDSANPGGERAEILSAMESLLNELPTPTPPAASTALRSRATAASTTPASATSMMPRSTPARRWTITIRPA